MPAMPHMSKRMMKIAYKILGKPQNKQGHIKDSYAWQKLNARDSRLVR